MDCFCYVSTHFALVKTDWIANTEIGLDPSSSVIKRSRCTTLHLITSCMLGSKNSALSAKYVCPDTLCIVYYHELALSSFVLLNLFDHAGLPLTFLYQS